MNGGSAPQAPDYAGAAQETAKGNLENLNAQTIANRPNQYTPWGNSTWSQAPDDTWTQTLTLDPLQQKALNDQMAIQSNQSALAKQLQGTVASRMEGGFTAPQLDSYLSGVGKVNQTIGGFNPSGPVTNTNFRSSAQGVDINAPQFDASTAAAGAKAAYGASTDLLKDQWAQDTQALDNKLRLQGLQPGTEAYNTAVQNLQRVQAQQQNQLADQAVVTGNNMANQNYSSALAGFGAKNTAIGQQYGQDVNTFNTGNNAQNQDYTQALARFGANQSSQLASNQAQQQAYEQALGKYGTAYSSAYQDYLQPLNSLNAVLNGNQVQMPGMPSFATAGYTPGADMSGATAQQGSWNQGIYNANQASAASTNAAGASSIAAIAAAFI